MYVKECRILRITIGIVLFVSKYTWKLRMNFRLVCHETLLTFQKYLIEIHKCIVG